MLQRPPNVTSTMNTAAACIDTRQVEIHLENDSCITGILGIFEQPSSKQAAIATTTPTGNDSSSIDTKQSLQLQVACPDQTEVFQVTVTESEIRQQLSLSALSQDAVAMLVSYLTTPAAAAGDDKDKDTTTAAAPVKTHFRLEQDENGVDRLQIRVLESVKGLARQRYSGYLTRTPTTGPKLSVFSFCTALDKMIHTLQDKAQGFQSQVKEVQTGLDSWKATAEKLQGGWESDKSTLLENFLGLYNQKQQEVIKYQELIDRLKMEHESEREVWATQGATKRPSRQQPLPDALRSVLADDDVEHYSPDLVASLAAGPKGAAAATAAAIKQARPSPVTSGGGVFKKQRRNPATGALEIFDADAMLNDLLVFPKKEDNGGGGKPRAKAKPAKAKEKKRPASPESCGTPEVKGKQESEDPLIDEDTRNDIYSQLAAFNNEDADSEHGMI